MGDTILNINGNYIAYQHIDLQQNTITNSAPQGASIARVATDVECEEVQEEKNLRMCSYIATEKIEADGYYTVEEFEQMFHEAICKRCPEFGAFVEKYRQKGYIHFHGDTKRGVYEQLRLLYPDMKDYSYQNFCKYVYVP